MENKLFMLVPALLIAGCAKPLAPTMTTEDLNTSRSRLATLEALPVAASLPASGTATMNGRLGGTMTGDADGTLLGDLALTSDFAARTVSGQVTNINTFNDDDTPDQLLKGDLTVAGSITGSRLTGTANGTLTGVDGGFKGDSVTALNLDGMFRQNGGDLAVTGDVTGGGTGDFDIVLTNGKFYAE